MCRRKFAFYATVFAAALFLPNTAPAKQLVDGIAIVINNSIITVSQYERMKSKLQDEQPDASRQEILESIINRELMFQEAEKRKLKVSKEEIETAVENLKKNNNLDEQGFMEFIRDQNYTMQEFVDEVKSQIVIGKLIQFEVAISGFRIDDRKIEQFYLQKNPDADKSAQVRIAHILMEKQPAGAFEKAKKVARQARKNPDSFFELAGKHSIDTRTASRGGDLGYFKYDELIRPLQTAVQGAGKGDINGPVESESGFHIVKVLAVKEKGVVVPPEIKELLIEEISDMETSRMLESLLEKSLSEALIEVRI